MRLQIKRTFFTALLSVLFVAGVSRAEEYDVYVMAGQSNAGGHGYITPDSTNFGGITPENNLQGLRQEAYLKQQPNVFQFVRFGDTPTKDRPTLWVLRSDGIVPMQGGASMWGYAGDRTKLGKESPKHPFGPELGFTQALSATRPGRHVLVIKFSQGATSLSGDWNPTAGRVYKVATAGRAGHSYAGMLEAVRDGLAVLKARKDTYTLRGLLWQQGEADAKSSTDVYADQLTAFIAAVRKDLAMPSLLIAIGEPLQTNAGLNHIRAAQKRVADADPAVVLVTTEGLVGDSTYGGAVHFDTASMLKLGERYAAALAPLLGKK